MNRIFLTAILLLILAPAQARDTTSVAHRIWRWSNPIPEMADLSYVNPALKQCQHDISLCDIEAAGNIRKDSRAILPYDGDYSRQWLVGAHAYLKSNSSTLWGNAGYASGLTKNVIGYESADYDIVYPYATYDSSIGNFNCEKYSLMGGYADHRGRWFWGGQIAYDAAMHWRATDPRPKDVTGLLSMALGGAYDVCGDYAVGASLQAKVYKQTCDIMFVSEQGKIEIYQATGLGNHYARFAGASYTSHFSGFECMAMFNLYPLRKEEWVASLSVSHLNLDKILVDLNKLPLCDASQYAMQAQAGYMGGNWSVVADFVGTRRHGRENIFGDATSGVYPLIGSRLMYADNRWTANAKGLYIIDLSERKALDINIGASLIHRQEAYARPAQDVRYNRTLVYGGAAFRGQLGDRWNLKAYADAALLMSKRTDISIGIQSSMVVSHDYAIGASLSAHHAYWHDGENSNYAAVGINLYF